MAAGGSGDQRADAKKKEQVGPYGNAGRRVAREPGIRWPSATMDLPDAGAGQTVDPQYGRSDDVAADAGVRATWAPTMDTAAFAVESVQLLVDTLGRDR